MQVTGEEVTGAAEGSIKSESIFSRSSKAFTSLCAEFIIATVILAVFAIVAILTFAHDVVCWTQPVTTTTMYYSTPKSLR